MTIEAKPPYNIVLTNPDGSPSTPRARSNDQRDCRGCWMVPAKSQADGTYQLLEDWRTRALYVQPLLHGAWWECSVERAWDTLVGTSDPAHVVVVLMLWRRRNVVFSESVRTALQHHLATQADAPPPAMPPTQAEVAAIEVAFRDQNLATGVVGRR